MEKILVKNLACWYRRRFRKFRKYGVNLSLMLEKETVKLEDSLAAMIRITKENEQIDRITEIEKI